MVYLNDMKNEVGVKMTSFKFKAQSTADHYLWKGLGVEVGEGAEKQLILWNLVVRIVPYYMFHK